MNLDFPFHIDSRGRTATTGYDDHIRDMIEQVLFTNAGERVNRPDFGSGILKLTFEPNSPELAATLQFSVQAALQQRLGDVIEILALAVVCDEAALRVTVSYRVPGSTRPRESPFEESFEWSTPQ